MFFKKNFVRTNWMVPKEEYQKRNILIDHDIANKQKYLEEVKQFYSERQAFPKR